MLQFYEKKKHFIFKVHIEGDGKNIKEALLHALKNEISKVENNYNDDDFEVILQNETICIED